MKKITDVMAGHEGLALVCSVVMLPDIKACNLISELSSILIIYGISWTLQLNYCGVTDSHLWDILYAFDLFSTTLRKLWQPSSFFSQRDLIASIYGAN